MWTKYVVMPQLEITWIQQEISDKYDMTLSRASRRWDGASQSWDVAAEPLRVHGVANSFPSSHVIFDGLSPSSATVIDAVEIESTVW